MSAGYTSSGGATPFTAVSQTICPANSPCLRGVAVSCGAGYLCNSPEGTEFAEPDFRAPCSDGNPELYCAAAPAGNTSVVVGAAPSGYYTVGGRASCTDCGSEQFRDAATGECRACRRCSRFEYSTGGCSGASDRTCAACDAACPFGCTGAGSGNCRQRGTYLLDGVVTVCPAGSYCTSPASATSKQACPAGTYGASVGLSTTFCDGPCIHGFHCPLGSTRPDAALCHIACDGCTGPGADACEVCAPGYRDVAGTCEECGDCGVPHAVSGGDCEFTTAVAKRPCPPGMYCRNGYLAGACQEGFQCPGAYSSPNATDCGAADVYCPEGTATALPVPDGKYSGPETAPASRRYTIADCPAGLVCQDGYVLSASCSAHQLRNPALGSGWFSVDPAGGATSVGTVYCDNDIMDGQWSVIHAALGEDDEQPFVADGTEPDVSKARSDAAFTTSRAAKAGLSRITTETLLYRGPGSWLLIDRPPLDAGVADADGSGEIEVTVTAPTADGQGRLTATAYMGYRRGGISRGGDFYVSAVSRAGNPATGPDAGWCAQMYLYSSSSGDADSDAAYHSSLGLGGWTASRGRGAACDDGEGGGMAFFIAVRRIMRVTPYKSCREVLDADPNAATGAYTLASSTGTPAVVWCDMETAGGGWTVLYSTSGVDGEEPVTSDTEVDGNSLVLVTFNSPRLAKASISAESTETLLWRSSDVWLIADQPAFGASLTGTPTSETVSVNLRSSDGFTGVGRMGWSTANIGDGGDFGLLLGADAAFDGSNADAALLNSGCANHLLYSLSSAASDGDGGYDASVGLGAWTPTTPDTCSDGSEGGQLSFRVAVRDRAPMCRGGYTPVAGTEFCYRVFGSFGTVPGTTAAALCSSMDALPVTVPSAEANLVLQGLMGEDVEAGAWLGLSDTLVEGAAVWADGSLVSYTNWTAGDSGVGAYAQRDCSVFHAGTGSWHSVACEATLALPACMVPVGTYHRV